ncbi:saccharopine dehydrogenase family protein [Rhodococcus sp. SGAir0479]|uniref:saccharopine dehydrogenase family protein n=1 Tax=Rhodococcus sp. SGAir0479 TaxID=2567884 RepID=UPI0010CD43A8|nr:saccharopine dehydrogenase NADP-binding domain-containing protein [Rhodococcus sp. SGAir0479]QCQ91036.1 enoyl-ACP reductase [Rhodococcus sp. SGAir0479]
MTTRTRDLDVVVYGATGFVGKLVAEYLARNAPADTRIGLAGRSVDRLEKTRRALGPAAAEWPLLRVDATDEASLAELAATTHVVATTVGPYAKYGLPLVRACAEAGTDYVDLTGETPFARESIDRFHETATASGARIVHSCGFDSIPSDLGVHALHRQVQQDGAGELTDTTLVVTSMRGGVSGGTVDSLRTQIDVTKRDAALRRLTASPYSLSPDRAAEPDLGRQADLALARGRDIAPELSGWKAPFFMGPYNTRVVRRSNALTGHSYGKQFRYREVMNVGSSPVSPVLAGGVAVGMGALVAGLAFPPTRWVLDRVLPKPGQGPGEQSRTKGHFTIDIYGRTTTGARYTVRFAAKGDPGYAATAVMFGESALALALDRDALPETPGGVLTPATALGDVLVGRLRDAGFEIRARRA